MDQVKCQQCKECLAEHELERHMRARHALYFAAVRRWLRDMDAKMLNFEFALEDWKFSGQTSIALNIKREAA